MEILNIDKETITLILLFFLVTACLNKRYNNLSFIDSVLLFFPILSILYFIFG